MIETEIRAAFDRHDLHAATEISLRAYGEDIYTLLAGLHRSRDDADDAFSMFAERLFVTMSRFRWDCSMRTWVYMLARRASVDVRRTSRPDRRQAISDASISALVVQLRTATASYLHDAKKEAFAKLRDELPEDDRELLVLRVDREMEWLDLARVFLEGDPTKDDLDRESARLRKRFQLVKEKLRTEGIARGLIQQ